MVYKEIPLDFLEANPFQTRREYDAEALAGLATSSMDELGIRNPPIVRPHPKKEGRYQIASGHARVDAWRTLGKKTIMCRVEKLTDSQMKREVLVENVNRADLDEKERFQAIEQYREDLRLKIGEHGFIRKLSKETGIPDTTLSMVYDVQAIRQLLKVARMQLEEEASAYVIVGTKGLPDEDRVHLVVKATDMGWSGRTTLKVKTVLKDMEPEVRTLILEEKSRLPHSVIVAVAELEDPETQIAVIEYIQTHKLNEELALKFIERVREGELITEAKVVDEAEEVLKEIRNVYYTVKGWGVNQYKILGLRWGEAVELFNKIKEKMRELTVMRYD